MGMDWNIKLIVGLPKYELEEYFDADDDLLDRIYNGEEEDGLTISDGGEILGENYVGYLLMRRYMRGDRAPVLPLESFEMRLVRLMGKFMVRFDGRKPRVILAGDYV